jgi:Cytochrome oxidase complex assembly protein 1
MTATPPPLTISPPAPAAQRNWWNRNWKWFVPVLGVVVVSFGVMFIGGILLAVTTSMKSTGAYREAVERATQNEAVQAALGTPITSGFWVTGNFNVSGSSGRANLAIPISGPQGKATIHAVATRAAGKWTFDTLVVKIRATGERIDLLEQRQNGPRVWHRPVKVP